MSNRPLSLTAAELKEIASLTEIQDAWGGENAEVMEQILKDIYTVKFEYMNEVRVTSVIYSSSNRMYWVVNIQSLG